MTQGSLGSEVALQLSYHQPSLLILAGRNLAKLQATETVLKTASPGISTRLLELDLSSQEQVRKASVEVNAYAEPIDRLINNAAIMAVPYSKSVDGLESQFATNHIGHFLFTNLIMPKLLAAEKGARIVNVSSSGHKGEQIRFDDYGFEVSSTVCRPEQKRVITYAIEWNALLTIDNQNGATYEKWKAYGQTKTANMLFSLSLADKLASKNIQSYSLNPGIIPTGLAQSIPLEELRAYGKFFLHAGWPEPPRITCPAKLPCRYTHIDSTGWLDEHGNIVLDPKVGWKTLGEGAATTVVAAFDTSISRKSLPMTKPYTPPPPLPSSKKGHRTR